MTNFLGCVLRRSSPIIACFLIVAAGDGHAGQGWLPDVRMVTSENRPVNLVSDLIQDHPTVLAFIYTSCRTACPAMGSIIAHVPSLLAAEEVRFLLLSVDPDHDTPARMKAWGQQIGLDQKWTMLTGEWQEVKHLDAPLKMRLTLRAQHTTQLYVINPRTKTFVTIDALEEPWKLVHQIRTILHDESP